MKICQIVGYKNSGKTTVMNELIRYFSNQNKKVGSFKHHGHGGEPDVVKTTDSHQHYTAGSYMSGVQGETTTQLIFSNIKIEEVFRLYERMAIDILFIEGFKTADFPKIVLVKGKEDESLLNELSNIIAVGSWDENLLENVKYPIFPITKMESYLNQLAEYILD
ncbi:molybdopterin-guanine dinucleotide biosynthesis protein B [Lentibacillus sp. Marseille-P4043]|uniref:molybdopterin-guanine dinucleotide biosynthesis protein B n=1 Tax=Lentibacillus sp. Marseille-P4043 TaxID=2040293 RepID=UPI000D0B49AA|nr:molybdopterin-guanine dinucleotide biosynthesis protein B [Lentibacillus sp. Marseille-P4043]